MTVIEQVHGILLSLEKYYELGPLNALMTVLLSYSHEDFVQG
jgi:hypothetical protein